MTIKRTVSVMLVAIGLFLASVANAAPAKAPDIQKGKSGETGMIHVATCNDGKEYWNVTNEHRGACSGHGGVAVWMDGSEVKSKGRKTSYR